MVEGGFGRFRDKFRGRSTDSLNPDEVYLTYHDVSLTNDDVYTLRTDWLTDNVIAFWEEYLEREYLAALNTSKIILLRPSMSFLLYQTPDPNTLREVLPDLTNASHVFLPINDCQDVTDAEGGTHWSLLLVSILDGQAFHYDSLASANENEAVEVTRKISTLVNKQIRYLDLDDSPVQDNSTDCGVFVCMCMRHLLLKRLVIATPNNKINMSLRESKVDATAGRKEMLRIIDRIRKKQDRRRSYVTPSSSPHSRSSISSTSISTSCSSLRFILAVGLFVAVLAAILPMFYPELFSEIQYPWDNRFDFDNISIANIQTRLVPVYEQMHAQLLSAYRYIHIQLLLAYEQLYIYSLFAYENTHTQLTSAYEKLYTHLLPIYHQMYAQLLSAYEKAHNQLLPVYEQLYTQAQDLLDQGKNTLLRSEYFDLSRYLRRV